MKIAYFPMWVYVTMTNNSVKTFMGGKTAFNVLCDYLLLAMSTMSNIELQLYEGQRNEQKPYYLLKSDKTAVRTFYNWFIGGLEDDELYGFDSSEGAFITNKLGDKHELTFILSDSDADVKYGIFIPELSKFENGVTELAFEVHDRLDSHLLD